MFLQVLAGDQYLKQANQNRVRDVAIPAQRGDIVDRDGNVIVTSTLANVVGLDPRSLPQAERDAANTWGQDAGKLRNRTLKRHPDTQAQDIPLPRIPAPSPALERRFRSIGRVIELSPKTIQELVIRSLALTPYGNVRLRSGVPRTMIEYLQERSRSYRGVTSDRVYIRQYPQGDLAAHLLGYVGEIDPTQIGTARYKGALAGAEIGKDGVEAIYDGYLRGIDGERRLQVDSAGNFAGELRNSVRPAERRAQPQAHDRPRPAARRREGADGGHRGGARNHKPATGAAFVAMNPGNGQIYAMASYPTFKPSDFTGVVSTKKYKELRSSANGQPLIDRAVQGEYPPGSTFKPIAALATLQDPSSPVKADTPFLDKGHDVVDGIKRQNANGTSYGEITMVDALRVSSDLYFYSLGGRLNSPKTETIQGMARSLGLGHHTGIDLRRARRGASPTGSGARSATRSRWPAESASTSRSTRSTTRRAPSAAATPTCRGGTSATTRTSRSARATSWRRRSRWPSPTRASPRAGASRGRTSGSRSTVATATSCRRSRRRRRTGSTSTRPRARSC